MSAAPPAPGDEGPPGAGVRARWRRGPSPTVTAGSVYLLDDYTYVQVVAVAASTIAYRVRQGSRLRRQRTAAPEPFRQRIRAEVDGAFFPAFAARDGDPPSVAATLRSVLLGRVRRLARPPRSVAGEP